MSARTSLTVLLAVIVTAAAAAEPPRVVVTILPQQEFVRRVAGDRVHVQVLVQPGHSPATYEPTPKQMAQLAEAGLWLRIGVPFETRVLRNLADVAPDLDVVDGRRGIELLAMDEPLAAGSHHRGELDPHFWLDPLLVKLHVTTVRDALCALEPNHCEEFDSNLSTYHEQLEAVHRRVASALAPIAGRELFVFHPAYGYLARRYGLRQLAVETAGKEPTARQVVQLVDRARESGVRALFVQPQFSGSSARAMAETLGVELVELDPLAADYLGNLELIASRIADAYRE